MEARTTAARAEYKGLLWGKGSCSLPPLLPHSLGVHTEERGTEKEETTARKLPGTPGPSETRKPDGTRGEMGTERDRRKD